MDIIFIRQNQEAGKKLFQNTRTPEGDRPHVREKC